MSQVTILTGCAGTGKTERLLGEYRAALDQARLVRRLGTTLWLAPTRRIQVEILRQITEDRPACFAPNVLTFDGFAEKILQAAGRPASPVSPVMRRLLLRRIIQALCAKNELRHFQSIANTSGFLDVVSRFISELKSEDIWPETFVEACAKSKAANSRRDFELGLIYGDYQNQLNVQNWYDPEGRFWLARTAIAEGTRRPFESVLFLVVDGFTDFTQTQYEILGRLAGWIQKISISLPGEQPVSRPDLFLKPQSAISRIKAHLPRSVNFQIDHVSFVSESPAKGGGWSKTVRVISDRLFSSPRDPRFVQKASECPGLEIIESKGPQGEWKAIAARIKTLLGRSVRPQEIVIGLRSISTEGPPLRDYLASAGLPVWCEAETGLNSSPILKALTALLTLEIEDWPFEQLLTVLDSNYFSPPWREFKEGLAVRAVAAFLRRKQIHVGRELMLNVAARHLADEPQSAQSPSVSTKDLARLASSLLVRLSRCLERLRRSHTLLGWADLLAGIGDDLGWTKNSFTSPVTLRESDQLELELLQTILRTAAAADQKMSDSAPRELNLEEFAEELADLIGHESLASTKETGGCIRILSVEQIRNLNVPYLFVIGLTEKSFPMNQSEDCLLSESERKEFNERGIPLRRRSGQHTDEMMLFYSLVTRARHGLILSYPVVNSKGQEVYPSPYVTALKDLFVPESFKLTQEGKLSPVPAADQALTLTDLRLAAVDEARHGRPELYRTLLDEDSLKATCWNTLAACQVADLRFHEKGFTHYEGQLKDERNLAALRQRFGPKHQFSATELESYARCPFQFWLSTVLRIEAVDAPEEGTDYASRGMLLHEVLARLLIEGALSDSEQLKSRFLELINELLDREIPETGFQKSLINVERQILSQWAEAFAVQQSDYDLKMGEAMKRSHALPPEIPFGRLPDAKSDDPNVLPSIQFGAGESAVNVRGRIDRVDVGHVEGRPAYVVIDYKTGHRPTIKKDDFIAGRAIQLGLYLLAIKRLDLIDRDAIPFQMGYWTLRENGFKHAIGIGKLKQIDPAEIRWLEMLLDHLLPQFAAEIRSGRFVVENEDPNCTGRCAYRTVCRVNQIRPLAERLNKMSPARVDPSDPLEGG